MAYAATLNTQEKTLFKRLARLLCRIGNALVAPLEAGARMQEVLRLQQMSDAELAVHGITRDEIVSHVFRDRYCY